MDQRPIGVFDSGLGGLTAVRALRRFLPGEDIVYFGDTARVPYGGERAEVILRYARQDAAFLRTLDPKVLLIACGTVTVTALEPLRKENDLPVFGVVEPSCRAAVQATKNGRIGVAATQASVFSGLYAATLRRMMPAAEVWNAACPALVTLVEQGRVSPEDREVRETVRAYLAPLREADVDTLILGCTHFPLLREAVAAEMGPEVTLVDAGEAAAAALRELLQEGGLLAEREQGTVRFFVSGSPEEFEKNASVFLGEHLGGAERIDIERY